MDCYCIHHRERSVRTDLGKARRYDRQKKSVHSWVCHLHRELSVCWYCVESFFNYFLSHHPGTGELCRLPDCYGYHRGHFYRRQTARPSPRHLVSVICSGCNIRPPHRRAYHRPPGLALGIFHQLPARSRRPRYGPQLYKRVRRRDDKARLRLVGSICTRSGAFSARPRPRLWPRLGVDVGQ